MASDYDVHESDVLVIGAGGAGLRAAVEASRQGAKTTLVCKSLLGKAHTVMAEGGMAASLGNVDPDDSWQTHFYDTMMSAKFIADWRTIEIFAREAPERVLELERWGAVFDRTKEGKINQRPFGAHTYRRLAHVGDRTGLELIRTLQDKGVHSGIDVYMEVTLTRLVKDGERVVGAFGYVRETGKFVLFRAKAVVLATGGWGKVYKVTSNSWESTGDGVGMALEAGAVVQDMEMVQFHPTGMVWPPGVKGILVTEAVRGEGGILLNSEGERFMEKYDPERMELSSRDVVARGIWKEVQAGRGSEHGGAYLDVTHKGADVIKHKLPSMYEQFLKLADIDITKEKMEVAPTIHYAMGGLRTDPETCATTVDGLFACGEVAAGLHGANRLGGNSLTDLLVFGRRAGLAAADDGTSQDLGAVDEQQIRTEKELLLAPFESGGDENPYSLHEELQGIMQDGCGIQRDGATLEDALAKVEALKPRLDRMHVGGSRMYNPGWHTCRDVRFMIAVCESILRAAIARTESRGAHWRKDHPDKDPEQRNVNYTGRLVDGRIELAKEPVGELPGHLADLFKEEEIQ